MANIAVSKIKMLSSVITIDGYACCFKSTFARALSQRLNFSVVSAGTIYRYVAYEILSSQLSIDSILEYIIKNLRLESSGNIVNDEIVLSKLNLYSYEINKIVSTLATDPKVVTCINSILLRFSENNNIIFDGRNLGYYLFPEAILKIFVSSTLRERMEHIRLTHTQKHIHLSEKEYRLLEENIRLRDQYDEQRSFQPLRCPNDAIIVNLIRTPIEHTVENIVTEYYHKLSIMERKLR